MMKVHACSVMAVMASWMSFAAAQTPVGGTLPHHHSPLLTHEPVLMQAEEPKEMPKDKPEAVPAPAAPAAPAAAPVMYGDGGCDSGCCDDGKGMKCKCPIVWFKPWTCEDLEMKPFEPGPKYCGCKGWFHCPKEEKKEECAANGNGEKKNGNGNGEKKNGNGEKKNGNGNGEKKDGNGNGNGEAAAEEEPEEEETLTPLMQAIKCCKPCKYDRMKKRGDNFYGWLQMGFTSNFASPENRTNFGTGYNWRSNDFQLNQVFLVYEKTLEQDDTVNFGYHISAMAGTDAPFNVQLGLFDDVVGTGQVNKIGVDLPQFFVEGHIPGFLGTNGLDIKIGKWYTLVNYEVIPAVGNFFYSHTYNFFFGPFNCTGALATWHVSDTIDIYGGIFRGWEKWEDNNERPSYTAALSWKSCDGRLLWFTACQTGPEQDDNNSDYRTAVSSYIKATFGSCSQWETYILGNYSIDFNAITNDQGVESAAPWYDAGCGLFYTVDPRLKLGFRAEWFADQTGYRTGVPGTYYDLTIGANYFPYQNLRIRPELRYDWSPNATPFNDGTSHNQGIFAVDVVWQF